jgi:CBS domain-containing protein
MPIYRELAQHPLRSIALEPPLSVTAETHLRAVVDTMRNSDTDYVLVTKEEVLAGIFTEHDLLNRAAHRDGIPDAPVGEFMSPDPTVLDVAQPISDALDAMAEGHYRHLPISDGDRGCIGVLTSYNVLHFLAELLPGSILNLPPRPHQTTRAPDGA